MQPYSDSHETEPVHEVHSFVVLDLDRTLLDTDELNRRMCERVVAAAGVDMRPEDGDPFSYIKGQKGKSFSVFGYFKARFGGEAVEDVMQYFLAVTDLGAEADLVYPSVVELLEELERQDIPHGILTYGDVENQTFKLALFHKLVGKHHEEIVALVTDERFKAQWIEANWKQDLTDKIGKEGFVVHRDLFPSHVLRAQNIVVVDDKRENTQAEEPRIVEFVVNNGQKDAEAQEQPIARLYTLVASGEFQAWVDKKIQQRLKTSA